MRVIQCKIFHRIQQHVQVSIAHHFPQIPKPPRNKDYHRKRNPGRSFAVAFLNGVCSLYMRVSYKLLFKPCLNFVNSPKSAYGGITVE